MTPRRAASRRGSGGQGGWEPRVRVRGRERRAVDLAVQGWTQSAIAGDLHVSQAAVSKILARADARALRELTATVERQKVRQTQRLERVFAHAMHAWDASTTDATRRRQRTTEGRGGTGQTVAEVTVHSQHGDPRYLETARKALADLRTLWGVDAPARLAVHTSRPYDHLTEAELLAHLAAQDALLASTAGRGARPRRPATEDHDAS